MRSSQGHYCEKHNGARIAVAPSHARIEASHFIRNPLEKELSGDPRLTLMPFASAKLKNLEIEVPIRTPLDRRVERRKIFV
jgi:hypothetical protein